MRKQESISLIVTSDNHYAILLAALLKSIEKNHKTGEKIDVYILDDNISSVNKSKIESTVTSDGMLLHWIDLGSVVPDGVKFPIDNSAFPLSCCNRIFAPYAIPKEVEKVIYLDVDMIMLEDISKLWNIELGDCLLGAVQDPVLTVSCSWGGIQNYKELGIPADTKYFNSGLLLVNLNKWREEDITNRVWNLMHENIRYLNFPDQYGLNGVLYNRWLELDARWNWYAQYENVSPYIIHFTHVKPIYKDPKFLNRVLSVKTQYSLPEFKAEFFDYLKLTPWKDYKPVSHYNRLLKKAYIKLKKRSLKILRPDNYA